MEEPLLAVEVWCQDHYLSPCSQSPAHLTPANTLSTPTSYHAIITRDKIKESQDGGGHDPFTGGHPKLHEAKKNNLNQLKLGLENLIKDFNEPKKFKNSNDEFLVQVNYICQF